MVYLRILLLIIKLFFMQKIKIYERASLISFLSFLLFFILLVRNDNETLYKFYDWSFIISLIFVGIFLGFYFNQIHIISKKQKDLYRQNYIACLQSKDKSDATYWGKLFYDYKSCITIHQQNNIQLQIQNDILSYSK